jgi:integrase
MPDPRIKLTKRTIAELEGEPGKQRIFWDRDVRGYGVLISPGGARSFIFQRRVGGKSRRVTIGRCDDLNPEVARKRAEVLAAEMGQGVDPVAEKRKAQAQGVTLAQVMAAYIAAPSRKGGGRGQPKTARTQRDIQTAMRWGLPDWLDRPASDVTGKMVRERHAALSERSQARADLTMRYLRAALNLAAADADEDDEPARPNPVLRLSRAGAWHAPKRAERHVPPDRLADWWDAVESKLIGLRYEAEMRDAMVFLMLTGCRCAEAIGNQTDGYPALRWDAVDLAKGLVRFEQTKNRRVHVLPIGTWLLARLRERHGSVGGSFVFGDAHGVVPPMLREAVNRIERVTGIRATPHDLRRTFASTAVRAGVSGPVLKRLLNHTQAGDVTHGYVQIDLGQMRDAVQRIENTHLTKT